MARFVKGSSSTTGTAQGDSTGQAVVPKGTTAQRPAVAQIGALRFNSVSNRMEYYDGSGWRNMTPGGTISILKDGNVVGDGSTTVFTNFFTTAPQDENNVIVVVGNVLQEPDQAYTISGRDITFTSPPPDTHRVYAFVGLDSTVTDNLI